MNQRFDTILKSGTVVNQDGEGIRDIGVTNGRIAAIGGLGQGSAGGGVDCKGLDIPPGGMDTPGPFPGPGPTPKGKPQTRAPRPPHVCGTASVGMPNTP